jgi:hypothetical protein
MKKKDDEIAHLLIAAKRLNEVSGTANQNAVHAAVAIFTQPTVESIRSTERTRSSVG